MNLTELIGREVIYKGNKCPVLDVAKGSDGGNVLQLKVVETEYTKDTIWCDVDEIRINVYFTARPNLFGMMVDAYDGYAKVEWKDAEGITVPFRPDPKTGYLMLDKEHRPIMMMKVFDTPLAEISLY
tara:strand:+ start:225 stop:605 length:381 start_codon:yes stop_codon:yes gene_type:complete